MTALEVVVRGQARARYPAERATVTLSANFEGTDRESVFRRAVALQDPLVRELDELRDTGAVTRWHSDQLRVFSYRPYSEKGARPLMFRVAIGVEAEFADFERLSACLDRWAVEDGVDVGRTAWDVTEDNRRRYEADLRRAAVADATAKAQDFADAAGRGAVTAVQLADPGMLGDHERPMARMMLAGAPDAGPALELRPDDIELDVAVDARFVAE